MLYSCSDAASGVQSCDGPVPSGAGIDTSTVGDKRFTVTSKDVADTVTGSLHDAKQLATRLGGALTVIVLLSTFAIAVLLTLSSVTEPSKGTATFLTRRIFNAK